MHVNFPWNVPRRTSGFYLVGMSSEPRQSVGGAFSVQPRLGAHWTAALTVLAANEPSTLALEAFVVGMEGMLGTTDVPVYQRFGALDAQFRAAPEGAIAPLGDCGLGAGHGSLTSEHWGFEAQPAVFAVLAEAAALRATEVVIARSGVAALRPGQSFGIGGRLHRAQLVWSVSDGVDRVRFQPPLRAAAPSAAAVTLNGITCPMRFSSAEEGAQVFDPGPARAVTLNFVEAI